MTVTAAAPGFVVNGLKREQFVAMNSMVLHEVFFDGLREESEPGSELVDALAMTSGASSAGAPSSRIGPASAAAPVRSCSPRAL
jgi:hypothetical protein